MAAKRTIPPPYRSGAAERAAAVGRLYYATIDGDPPCHAIEVRDPEGNVLNVLRRPHYDAIDVAHEVEQLNNGTPINRRSRGRMSGGNRKLKDGGFRIGEVTVPSPTEMVGRLIFPLSPTAEKLRAVQSSGGTLDRAELRGLIEQAAPYEWRAFNNFAGLAPAMVDRRQEKIDRFIENVSKQLKEKFHI